MSDCATPGGLTLPLPLFSTYVSRNSFTLVAVKMRLNETVDIHKISTEN